LLQLVQLF